MVLYLGYFSILFEKNYVLNWNFDMKSVIVDFFSFVLLEKKHHKATFPIKISVQKITILEISTLLSFEWANPESGKIQNTNTSILNFTAFIFFKQDKNIFLVLAYLLCIRSFLLRKKWICISSSHSPCCKYCLIRYLQNILKFWSKRWWHCNRKL